MNLRPLGASGLHVSAIGLGAMPLSLEGRPSEADSIRVIRAALDAGITLIDTADVYCLDDDDLGHNERLIAKALRERGGAARAGVVVATKGGCERPRGAWTVNGKPRHLAAACERSMKALGVETIDLYQLHAPDSKTRFADTIGALAELRAAGKVRHVGLSNVSVDEIEEARAIVPIVSVQNRCSPFDTNAFTQGVVAHCEAQGIAFLPHSPVGGHRGHVRTPASAPLQAVARRHGASPYEVCLAYLLALTPVMIPIPGASKVASAQSSARAADLTLTADDLSTLRQAFPGARVRA